MSIKLDKDRIRALQEKFTSNQVELLKKFGWSQQNLHYWLEQGKSPSIEKFNTLVEAGISLDWFFTGKGQMFTQIDEKTKEEEYTYVKRFDARASAGKGNIVYDETELPPLAFRSDWLSKKSLNPLNLSVCTVTGDSMAPDLQDGDNLLIDHSKEAITGKKFVLRIQDEIFVKMLQITPNGKYQAISINKNYPTYEIEPGDAAEIIGLVVWSDRSH